MIVQNESKDYHDLWLSLLLFTAHVKKGPRADYLTQTRAEEAPDDCGVITRETEMKRTETVHRAFFSPPQRLETTSEQSLPDCDL